MAYNQNTRETVRSSESKSSRDSTRSKKSYQSSDQEFGISRVLGSKATKSLKLIAYTSSNYLHFAKSIKSMRKNLIAILPNRYSVIDIGVVFV